MSIQVTDQESEAVRKDAPRATLADMEAKIALKTFATADELLVELTEENVDFIPTLKLLTLCVLVLDNGFTLVGKSAPASPENFDAEYGRKLAYEDCIRQLWPLEGYLLRNELAQA